MTCFIGNFSKKERNNNEKKNMTKAITKGALIGGGAVLGVGLGEAGVRGLINARKNKTGLKYALKNAAGHYSPKHMIGRENLIVGGISAAGAAGLGGYYGYDNEKNKPWLIRKGYLKKPMLDENGKPNKGVF